MSEGFLGEIRIVSFNFAPKNWALANGQFMPINQNQALFSLLGTMYGGNGQTTFALPNFRGRLPMHFGNGHDLGEAAGSTSVTVSTQQLPAHTHAMVTSTSLATLSTPDGNLLGKKGRLGRDIYANPTNLTTLGATTSAIGGSQPHNNMSPYLVLNFIICLSGTFPSRN
jgi:microcystin-dependent protein